MYADRTVILEELRSTVDRALFLLHHEVELMRGQEADDAHRTSGGRILIDVVEDKRTLAAARIFILLGLLYPSEDFRTIRSGIRSRRATKRASGIELLENLLEPELRRATIALVSLAEPQACLRAADPDRFDSSTEYRLVVEDLANDASEAVRAFAMYHAAELEPEDESMSTQTGAELRGESMRERAIGIIERLPEAPGSSANPAVAA
jgi:hypothetical protein